MRRRSLVISAALAALIVLPAAAQDELEALPEGEGREDLFYNCAACHSLRTVTAQRLSERRWDRILDEMVEVHGMMELDEETRAVILDYLAEHFSPES